MVVPLGDVRREGILAGVSARAVTAVVAERDGLGQGGVEADGASNAHGDLGHFEGMGQPGALMVIGGDEDLRLAGQTPEGVGMQDAIPVTFEAGAKRVGRFRAGSPAGSRRPGGSGGQRRAVSLLTIEA